MTDATTERVLTWDAMTVGDELGPIEFDLTPDVAASFAAASDLGPDAAALLVDDRGRPAAHPLLSLSDYATLIGNRYGRMGSGLHTRHQTRVRRPVPVGAHVVTTGRVVELFQKRGRDFWVVEYDSRIDDGSVVVTHRMTASVDRPRQDQPGGDHPGGDQPGGDQAPSPGAAPGAPAQQPPWQPAGGTRPIVHTFTLDMQVEFARQYRLRYGETGAPPANAHTSVEYAHAVGLPDAVAHSSHYYCWFAETGLLRYGTAWLSGGEVEARFLAPVFPGGTVTVESADDDGDGFAVRATSGSGRLVSVGRASLPLSDRETGRSGR